MAAVAAVGREPAISDTVSMLKRPRDQLLSRALMPVVCTCVLRFSVIACNLWVVAIPLPALRHLPGDLETSSKSLYLLALGSAWGQPKGAKGVALMKNAAPPQAVGIRYIGFRNEQAAGYAAAASGFLTGDPGVLLTVSGPGAVHGIAGLSHAQVNTWPMILLSGSAEQVSGLCSCLRLAACFTALMLKFGGIWCTLSTGP